MRLLKLILLLLFTLNIAYAKDINTKILYVPYSFMSAGIVQDTDAKFLLYADNFDNATSLSEGVGLIFANASKPENLAKYISKAEEVAKAQEFLAGLGAISEVEFSYAVCDGDAIVVFLKSLKDAKKCDYMLINKEGKWEVSKESPLYAYLAKNISRAVFLEKAEIDRGKIELYTADGTLLSTAKDDEALSSDEVMFYYIELYDAFFEKNFDQFRTFLDSNSGYTFAEKVEDSDDADKIAELLGDELKEQREYLNLANLGGIYAIFYNSSAGEGEEKVLKFAFVRDISCGVELMNYGVEPDAVLQDYISR